MLRYLFLISIFPLYSQAQPSNFGNWLIYFGDKKINDKWNIHHELQYRNFNMLGDIDQILIRTGIGYNLTEKNNNVLLGYGYIYNEPYINNTDLKTSFSEHRIFQQFISKQAFGRFNWLHRYRFEQRFIGEDFKLRLRYFLSMNMAINKKEMMDNTLYLSAYNEIFVNNRQNYFDRNRLYGGLGYRFSKQFRFEIGVMNQAASAFARNQLNVMAFVNF